MHHDPMLPVIMARRYECNFVNILCLRNTKHTQVAHNDSTYDYNESWYPLDQYICMDSYVSIIQFRLMSKMIVLDID